VRTPVEPVYVPRRPQTVSVPQEEEPETAVSTAQNENSSIAVAAPTEVSSAEQPESVENIIVEKDKSAEKVVAPTKVADASIAPVSTPAKRLDCKHFFPSVGIASDRGPSEPRRLASRPPSGQLTSASPGRKAGAHCSLLRDTDKQCSIFRPHR